MSDAPTSKHSDSLVAEVIALAESGDLALASKICVEILGSMQDTLELLADHALVPKTEDRQTSNVAPEVPYILALASLQSGDLDRAERCFAWVARDLPHQNEAPYMLTQVARARNDDFKAANVLRWFLDLFPDNSDEHVALGDIYFRFGRYGDALSHFRHAQELMPDNPEIRARIEASTPLTLTEFDPRALIESTSQRPKLAVFISDLPRWREAKLAQSLRRLGWNVVLLFRYSLRFAPEKYFDACYWYWTPDDALAAARAWKADIYHMFTQLNYETAEVVLRDRPGSVVVDPYDIFEGTFENEFYTALPRMLERRGKESAVLTCADGICSRDLMVQAPRHRLNLCTPSVFFPEFCWNDQTVKLSEKLHCRDGELHVVFGSSIVLKTSDGEYTYESYHWLAKILNENAVHFHIYPMIHPDELESLKREFSQLERDLPYFHLHEPVYGDEWLTELSQYDVGVCFTFADAAGMPKKITTDVGLNTGLGNKISDYLDAGLVMLTSTGGISGWLTSRYGFGEALTGKV